MPDEITPQSAVEVSQVETPQAPVENLATPQETPVAAPAEKAPPTLSDIIAQRRAVVETPVVEATPEAKPEVVTPEQKPEDSATATQATLEQTQRDQLWALAQTDPSRLVEVLKAMHPEAPKEETETAVPEVFSAQKYAQEVYTKSQEIYAERGALTLADLLGGQENLQELGLENLDFTDSISDFMMRTLSPQFAATLDVIGQLREEVHQLKSQLSPVMSQAQEQSLVQAVTPAILEVFPEAKGNQAAIDHYHETFKNVASLIYPKELIENPQSNPQEYVKMCKVIAVMAAREFARTSPAQTIETPPAPQPPTAPALSPAPAPVVPNYRNHLGQFQGERKPTSLAEANRLRAEQYASA